MLFSNDLTEMENMVSDLWRQLNGVTFEISEICPPDVQHPGDVNRFGMSFLEQQDVILATLLSFQECHPG